MEVKEGQLNLEFQGENWACCVSAVVIYPVAEAARGEAFLDYVLAKRRFYFDNYFKRILHRPTGDPLPWSIDNYRVGYVLFQSDFMRDIFPNDTPYEAEKVRMLRGEAFAGEYEPVTVGVVPLRNLGNVTVSCSDLIGQGGTIPSRAIDVGFVSNRLSRLTMEGTVYTISPRLIMPGGSADVPIGLTRRFWLTIRTPADARPGLYKGTVTIHPEKAHKADVPLEFRVRSGTLDPVDIPAGPFGHRIGIPWYDDDPQAVSFNKQMTTNSLRKLREYGFTSFSGVPMIAYRGFQGGKPVLDFRTADAQMKQAKDLGFLAVVTYGGGVSSLDAYYQDKSQMTAAGFQDYAGFLKAIYTEVQTHARQSGWIPVYFNIGDEPVGEDVVRSSENAEAYRKAFPKGPPFFTAASSFTGNDRQNPHFRLSKALHVVEWNDHDEAGVNLLHQADSDWSFYNGGNRWTFGTYMYKAAKQFGMKYRLSWHWNVVAGDPYYALDCREDDYAWCNASPDGRLIPSVELNGCARAWMTIDGCSRSRAWQAGIPAIRRPSPPAR